jgi:hypothetical protein
MYSNGRALLLPDDNAHDDPLNWYRYRFLPRKDRHGEFFYNAKLEERAGIETS